MQVAVKLNKLHNKQKEIVQSKAKRKMVKAGRRGGKTVLESDIAVNALLDGKRILYATPTSEQIQKFWFEVTSALQPLIEKGIYKKNESIHTIEKPGTEERIHAKTAWNADSLRGDWCDLLLLDEYQLMNEDAWDRVGSPMLLDNDGDAVFTFTPPSFRTRSVTKADDPLHANKLFKVKDKDKSGRWECFHFTSFDNPYISHDALDSITDDMTELAYRQEIMAEDVDEVPGALWTRKMIDDTRVAEKPKFVKIGVGVDPQGRKKIGSLTGIVGVGLGENGHLYIICDKSVNMKPLGWGRTAISEYQDSKANAIVVERNYGGDMVKATIENINDRVYVKEVNASRGKYLRAEPIAAKHEKGKVHIVGRLPELEDEMCTYTPETRESPNRLDAMVWACTYLLKGNQDWDQWGTT